MRRSLFFLFLFTPVLLIAQGKNTYLSLEVGGSGIIASANIARSLIKYERFKIIAQTGIGLAPKTAKSEYAFDFPVQIACDFGAHGILFEAGIGSTFIFKSNLDKTPAQPATNEIYLSPIVGFRHESTRWFGRIFACPLFHATGKSLYDNVTTDFIKFGIGIGAIF